MPVPIRVLVADDHAVVRLGIRRLLADQARYFVVGEVASAAAVLEGVRHWQPDVLVLDVRLPDGSGVEVCRAVRVERPATQVVMLTSFTDDEALIGAVSAGAIGYVLKGTEPDQLTRAIDRAAAGEPMLDSISTRDMLEWVQKHTGDAPIAAPLASLTDQERRVLPLIVRGLTNRQIGEALFVSDQTVKGYVSAILRKLNLTRRSEAAAFAARHLPSEQAPTPRNESAA
jgi:DNA-binding NarL/FixJ family response regulator